MRHILQRELPKPVLDAVTLTTTRTSDAFSAAGYNMVSVYVTFVKSGSTTLDGLTMQLQSNLQEDSNFFAETEEGASTPNTVAVNPDGRLYDYFEEDTPADGTHRFVEHIPVNTTNNCQLVVTPANGLAADLFTARIVLSAQ